MGHIYDNPPLIEARCTFRFSPESEWDSTIPGRLYERLKDDFPTKRSGKHVNIDVVAEEEFVQPSFHAKERTSFLSEDEKYIVQLLPNVLTVHRRAPYPSWDDFRPVVVDVFGQYAELAQPARVHRADVAYLNHIEFDEQTVSLENNFDFYVHIGDGFPGEHGRFIAGVEFLRQNEEVLRAEMRAAQPKASEAGAAIRLDLLYAATQPMQFDEFEAPVWLERAHDEIEDAFEATILDSLRQKFGLREDQ